jgi:hypothetical protein
LELTVLGRAENGYDRSNPRTSVLDYYEGPLFNRIADYPTLPLTFQVVWQLLDRGATPLDCLESACPTIFLKETIAIFWLRTTF